MLWIAVRRTALLLAVLASSSEPLAAQGPERPPERIFYLTGAESSFRSFRDHVRRIDVVAPQVFSVEGDGLVWGEVDPRVAALAREHGVRVMPLIHNPGFRQESIHALLHDPEARARTIGALVVLGRAEGFWGWQFDFENIHVADRDAYTAFYREAAAALHAAGMTISVAVVPTDGLPGVTPFHRYMQANWRGSFDLAALADAGDFISLMTYAQHGTVTTPGPVAGLPWMRRMVRYALAQGVPPEKLSLGLPTYSAHWRAGWDAERGAGVRGREIHFEDVQILLERSGAEVRWDATQGAGYAFWERAGTFEWVFVEDRRAFAAKLALLREFPGLRGISVWVLGAEDPGVWDELEGVTR